MSGEVFRLGRYHSASLTNRSSCRQTAGAQFTTNRIRSNSGTMNYESTTSGGPRKRLAQLSSTVRWRYEMSKWLTYLSLVSLVFLLGCGYTILKPSVTNGNPSGQDLPSVTVEPDNTVDLYDSLLITEWQGTGKCVDHMALFGGPDFKVFFSLDHTWVLQTDNLSIFGDWQSRISEGKYQVSLTTVGYPRMPRGSCTLSTDGLEMNLRLWGPTQIDCGVSLCPRDHPCAKYY